MTDGPAVFGFVYANDEPYKAPDALEGALEAFKKRVGVSPASMMLTSTGGRNYGSKRFSLETFRAACADDRRGGSVYLSGRGRGKEEMTVRYYLRHHHPVDKRFQPPARHYAVPLAGATPATRRERVAALTDFLLAASAPSGTLHGGVGAASDMQAGINEILMTVEVSAVLGDVGPPHRFSYDSRHEYELWTKARAPYWITILGPALATAAGAPPSTAARVERRGDCLIVQSTDDVLDYLSPDWPRLANDIRRWLWPHTIQNPAYAPEGGI